MLAELSHDFPDNVEVAFARANIEMHYEDYHNAIGLLRKTTKNLPKIIKPWLMLASCYQYTHQLEKASGCYKKALKLEPNNDAALFQFAGCLMSFGKQQLAIFQLQRVLEVNPIHAGAMLALSELHDFNSEHSLFDKMKESLKHFESLQVTKADPYSKMELMKIQYALGNAHDALGDYQNAYNHWKQANLIQFQQCKFHTREMQPFFDSLIEQFNADVFTQKQASIASSTTPIFIISMPRSGSTLLESKLLNDPRFSSIGESNILQRKLVPLIEQWTGQPYPINLSKLSALQLAELGTAYLSTTKEMAGANTFVIDKLPANFQSMGLIKLILPNAKFIHLERTKEAVSLSIFRNYFAANEPYFCDWQNIHLYYQFYLKLMTHWRTIPSIDTLEINYEDLIADQEKVLGKIEQYLGDISLHKKQGSKRTGRVDTLSVNQVRKPIYNTSVEHWKNYSEFLGSE